MSKAIYFTGLFLLGCIASSFLTWLGAIHPGLSRPIIGLFFLIGLLWGLCFFFDDAIAKNLNIPTADLYAILLSFGFSVALGGVATWLSR